MCGRFTLTVDPAALQMAFPQIEIPDPTRLAPRYNLAPTQPVAVVFNDGKKDRLDFFNWGLIPSWAKDPEIGSRLINARLETLAEKPAFRSAYRRRRCLILADGFYEWTENPQGKGKTPVYIYLTMKDQPTSRLLFAFAGLWETWTAPKGEGSEIRSCTIITTQPNDFMKSFHSRMPVILDPNVYRAWISPGEHKPETLQPLFAPYPPADSDILMTAHSVSPLVNSPRNDQAACIAPVTL
jgi:putative SOS response-associated peptidase YedK